MSDPIANVMMSAEIGELSAALTAAQAEIVGAVKDSSNPFFKSKYADLATVWEACRKQLTGNGLSVVQMPVGSGGLVTVLMHRSGQYIGSRCEADTKDHAPQAVGSALTYLRRYSLAAFAGVPQIDDDGNSAEGHDKPAAKATPKAKAVADAGAVPFVTDAPPDWEESQDHDDPNDMPNGVFVTKVKTLKTGTNAKGPWKMSAIGFSDGTEGVTFDEATTAHAEVYMANKTVVQPTLSPSPNGKGNNVASILRLT